MAIKYEWVYTVCKDYDDLAKLLNSLNQWQHEQLHIIEGMMVIVYYRVRT